MNDMSRLIVCLLCFLTCVGVGAVSIPREHVFVFERNTNSNYVCYDVNLVDGKLCQKEPLKPYWVLGEGTRVEGLTFLDRKMAFGVKVVKADEAEATVHLTAYKDLKIRVCKRDGKWVGVVRVGGREMVLQKMFAQMKAPMNVKCEYVDIIGTDATSGKKCSERILP